jgi:hypothetical protein
MKIRIRIVITIMKDIRSAIIIPPDIWPMNQVITNSFQVGLPATLVATNELLLNYCTFVSTETLASGEGRGGGLWGLEPPLVISHSGRGYS